MGNLSIGEKNDHTNKKNDYQVKNAWSSYKKKHDYTSHKSFLRVIKKLLKSSQSQSFLTWLDLDLSHFWLDSTWT